MGRDRDRGKLKRGKERRKEREGERGKESQRECIRKITCTGQPMLD